MNRNILYKSTEIESYYSKNRINWSEFYPSEKNVLEYSKLNKNNRILDIGCGCGGLGIALKQRFGITDYTGIDINKNAIKKAIELNPKGKFIADDFLNISKDIFKKKDIIISLSCIDWNIEFFLMLEKVWSLLDFGKFILSIRLTNEETINDLKSSYQFINFSGLKEGEIAPYNIYNFQNLLENFRALSNISSIYAYGYNGKPSNTAVTKLEEVCFAVFSLSKNPSFSGKLKENILLPKEFII